MDVTTFSETEVGQALKESNAAGSSHQKEDLLDPTNELQDLEALTDDDDDEDDNQDNILQEVMGCDSSEDEDEDVEPRIFGESTAENIGLEEPRADSEPLWVRKYAGTVPVVPEHGPAFKLPDCVSKNAQMLAAWVARQNNIKKYSDLGTAEKKKVQKLLMSWQKEMPECNDQLFKQISVEVTAYVFIKQLVSRNENEFDDDALLKLDVRERSSQQFMKDVFEWNGEGVGVEPNDIITFVKKLKDHAEFRKYKEEMDKLNDDDLAAIVWRASVQAQRLFIRLSKLHESVLEGAQAMSKMNQEAAAKTREECAKLVDAIRRETDEWSANSEMMDSTLQGRRQLFRSLCSPYFKTREGLAAPKDKPSPLPFRIQDLREQRCSYGTVVEMELRSLQNCVLTAVILKKTAEVEDRCAQLLTKCMENQTAEVRIRVPCGGLDVSAILSVDQVLSWKGTTVAAIKTIDIDAVLMLPKEDIDWMIVASKMGSLIGRAVTPTDCKRMWDFVLLPRLEGLTIANDLEKIKRLIKLVGSYRTTSHDWEAIAAKMGPGYTALNCFVTYSNFMFGELTPQQRSEKTADDMRVAATKFAEVAKLGEGFHPSDTKRDLNLLACKTAKFVNAMPANITMRDAANNYNRFLNPLLRKNKFKVIEDVLLLVVITKLRPYIVTAENLSPIQHYLPWRHLSVWTTRADNLFTRQRSIFTLEEDLVLLNWIKEKNEFDFSVLKPQLRPDKSRKQTLHRFNVISQKLEHSSFEIVSEQCSNKRLFRNYERYIPDLKRAIGSPIVEPLSFHDLRNNPANDVLFKYLCSFEKNYLKETLRDVEVLAEKAKLELMQAEIPPAHVELPKLDRRKFIRGDPISTASTLAARRVDLVNPPTGNLNTFEELVYKYYDMYVRKSIKANTVQYKYLPTAENLVKFQELRNIVVDVTGAPLPDDFQSDGTQLNEEGYPINAQVPKGKPGRKFKRQVAKGVGRPKKARMEY